MPEEKNKKAGSKDENVGSFAPDPSELEAHQEEEAKQLLEKSTNPNAPLFKKLDAIVTAINGLTHQLCRIADKTSGIETKSTATVTVSEEVPTTPEAPLPQPPEDISAVMDLFPIDLESKLKFSKQEDGQIKVAPRQFLGSENFAKVASIVRAVDGKYVSAGKESHFLITPLGEAPSSITPKGKTDEIKSKFPPVLADMLTFEEKDDQIIVKAKKFLGSDNFAKIAGIIRDIGGDYISAGKESRFEVPIK